jgi:uncharacterized protein with PIN domain
MDTLSMWLDSDVEQRARWLRIIGVNGTAASVVATMDYDDAIAELTAENDYRGVMAALADAMGL